MAHDAQATRRCDAQAREPPPGETLMIGSSCPPRRACRAKTRNAEDARWRRPYRHAITWVGIRALHGTVFLVNRLRFPGVRFGP